ncbi:acyl carrier protein [Lachnospiraceae bacterium oral taxon 096]|nr:acyl carrier protein [Lachnospiraceae bacterium]PTL27522.1 acyl carrier protein [Lachnospiraceae bacterium oral taxon 096]QUI96755.1 acyl carrier protein [Lachnospiraceae bacterium oral taxon 096]
MTREEAFERVVDICRDVFENDDLELNDESNANTVDEWDSLTHLNLINDIEEEFKMKFTLDEFSNSANLGELVDALMKHLN